MRAVRGEGGRELGSAVVVRVAAASVPVQVDEAGDHGRAAQIDGLIGIRSTRTRPRRRDGVAVESTQASGSSPRSSMRVAPCSRVVVI